MVVHQNRPPVDRGSRATSTSHPGNRATSAGYAGSRGGIGNSAALQLHQQDVPRGKDGPIRPENVTRTGADGIPSVGSPQESHIDPAMVGRFVMDDPPRLLAEGGLPKQPQHRACDPFDRPSTTGSLPPRYTLSESAFLSNAAVPFPRTPHPIRSFPDPGNQKNSPGSRTAHPAYPPGAPPWPEPPTAGRPASIQQFSFSSSKVREDYPCKPILHGYLRKAPGERLPATVSCL